MTEQHEPRIRAEFVLDKEKKDPIEVEGNYRIKLFVEGAPDDTYAVTYKLHESYYDPLREARERPNFEEEITSYGDYAVRAVIQRMKKSEEISETLSTALRRTYGDNPPPGINSAIQHIRAN
jgi:transcription initiation factor IIF auxiliary subunit